MTDYMDALGDVPGTAQNLPEGFDIDETMHGTLVIRPKADVATPADKDMEVVLELIRAEKAKGGTFDWWWWWTSVKQAMGNKDVPNWTLRMLLDLGIEKGFN